MKKRKRCKQCKKLFVPSRAMQAVCNPQCAYLMTKDSKAMAAQRKRLQTAQNRSDAKVRAAHKENDIGHVKKSAQQAFNAFIRYRDRNEPCISCKTYRDVQYCAGHFRTTGAAGHLRFSEDNCHRQCNRYCNMGLSGNIKQYRPNLIEKIGLEKVEALENDNQVHRWNIDELRAVRDEYRAKLKDMVR